MKSGDITRSWKFWLAATVWTAVWLWLKFKTGFPQSFGYHSDKRGKSGVLDEFLHSDLLLERPGVFEIVLFLWMWGIVVFGALWLISLGWSDIQRRRHRKKRPTDSPAEGES